MPLDSAGFLPAQLLPFLSHLHVRDKIFLSQYFSVEM